MDKDKTTTLIIHLPIKVEVHQDETGCTISAIDFPLVVERKTIQDGIEAFINSFETILKFKNNGKN